jgi:hypothetical protein
VAERERDRDVCAGALPLPDPRDREPERLPDDPPELLLEPEPEPLDLFCVAICLSP